MRRSVRGPVRPSPIALLPIALLPIVVLAFGAAGCVATDPDRDAVAGIEVPQGFEMVEVAAGLDGPTQLTRLPDGRLLVAELNGAETAGAGRVVAIDPAVDRAEGGFEVLFDGLTTPTGLAVLDDEIWVLERRTLSRGPIGGGTLTPVIEGLPFNGRSETTLTVTGDGTLLYATTGSLDPGGRPDEDSGILWEHDPDGVSTPVAAGFKNAYGHVFGQRDRLWATEVSDGRFDGEPAPDELVEVIPGVDHGWPRCIGDRVPVSELGADAATCADGAPSQALFDPGATPTSVAPSPWDGDVLLVALWGERRVVAVPAGADGRPHRPVDVVTGRFRPQHLLADGDRLLVVDFDGGRVLALQPT